MNGEETSQIVGTYILSITSWNCIALAPAKFLSDENEDIAIFIVSQPSFVEFSRRKKKKDFLNTLSSFKH